ncbi:VCBS repeat-containing protein [Chryseolinea lacunae]|uniref:VCBS repeat-containing protein n=1 Tax=Chryseolinea lacunae TaxID=2801331 RepID=A0ABS1KTS4_9BACT|nr:VCBS repeat-containing protein [Chryseolinea lacunae]MBL0742830.1 VCBS repeat-containing protein [Chryseolinea lacunae]
MMHTRLSCILALSIAFVFQACSPTPETAPPVFEALTPEQTGVSFSNLNPESQGQNILAYEYFYNGGGVALGDINNDGLVDLYFSANQGDNKLYLNKGNFTFEDITEKAGVAATSGWKTGVAMADVNGDGYLDLYVCRSGPQHEMLRQNALYINNKNLTFSNKAHDYGLDDDSYSTQAAFLDFDRDGDLDLFLLNHSRLTISNSYDVTRRYAKTRVPYVGNKLYRNDNNTFKDVSDSLGIYGPASNYGLGVVYGDLNDDGWPDLYASNDYTEKDNLLLNDHGHFFNDAGDSLLTHMSQFSMGVDMADVNNDGHMDLVTLDMLPDNNKRQKEFYWPDRYDVYAAMVKSGRHHQNMRNMLHLNNGNGTFSEVGQLAGIAGTDWSWAALFADYDNDGWQDLFVSNGFKRNFTSNDFLRYKIDLELKARQGQREATLQDVLNKMPSGTEHNYMFKNTNGVLFNDVSAPWGFAAKNLSNGAAYADLDNDGDLDLVFNNLDEPAGIYRNNAGTNGNHYLKVTLQGSDKNTAGLGATVTLYQGGKLMKRMLCPYRGFQSSVEPVLFFGLGQATVIDSLVVEWPKGERQTVLQMKGDQTLTLLQKDAVVKTVAPAKIVTQYREVAHAIPFKHIENDFVDFKVQPLLPRMYSTQGPALTSADINGDGLRDVFVGGAKGQHSALYVQTKDGSFREKSGVFDNKATPETIDAQFFDMDNDGDQDLYVVTGGYEYDTTDVALLDQLYRNDGKGNFTSVALPAHLSSGACVRPGDVDHDGDLDLFVGARIKPGRYPEAPESCLLLNDGKGNFTNATSTLAPDLIRPGMVTDAVWLDVNNDTWLDLVMVGEWMPVKIYINDHGKLKDKTTLYSKEKTGGWWNRILAEDFDGDGRKDLVIGNFGMNNLFKATPARPVKLYAADFDNNGSVDPLMTYFIGSAAYPMPTRDELTDQLPSFKKRFPDYATYTTATVETILNPAELGKARVFEASTFETLYLKNTGNGFIPHALPIQIQFAPVMALAAVDVNGDGKPDLVTGGNLTATRSRFGKATASFGDVFLNDGKGGFSHLDPKTSGLILRGDVRNIVVLENGNLLFGINNAFPTLFRR